MNRLHEIIEDQFAEAKAKAGQKIIRRLGRGLRIEMTYINRDVQLAITRDDKYPSLQEWATVTSHFPCSVQKVEPTPDQNGSRYTLSARLALARAEQLKF